MELSNLLEYMKNSLKRKIQLSHSPTQIKKIHGKNCEI